MRRIVFVLVAVGALAGVVAYKAPASGQADGEAAPIFGVKIPFGYRDWRLISVAREEGDLDDLRAILGNDIAIKAYREGKLPFPDGTIIARLAWSYVPSEENQQSLWPSPVFRGRATQERGSVHGQGLKQIRLDRRLGIRSIRRRQARRRGEAQHLLSLPHARRSSRLCLHPLRTLEGQGPSQGAVIINMKLEV